MLRRSMLVAAAAIAATQSGKAFATEPPIRLGVIGISFHAVAGAVVQRVLERLGHRVEVSNAPHDAMFDRLGRGDVDLLAAAWMPGTHSHLFSPIAEAIAPVATLYDNALLYWAVPAYVPADVVASVEDLTEPDVAGRMDRTIRSIGPSAGLSIRSLRMVQAYGLAAAGYTVVPGETAEWLGTFRSAYAAERWIVMPLWQPHFLNRTHQMRILRDPMGVMGTPDKAILVANRGFAGRLPQRTQRALAAIDIGLDGITEMDLAVNTRGLTALAAADAWMAAEGTRVSRWLV